MKKLRFSLAFVLLSILLTSCTTVKESETTIPEKETTQVSSGSISMSSSKIGYVEAQESAPVWAKIGGRIVSLSVEKGDRVKAGQILAKLDGSEVKEGYATASDTLSSTKKVYDNTSVLFDAQIISMKEKINQAKNGIALAESSLEWANTGIRDTSDATTSALETASKQVEQSALAEESASAQLENTKNLIASKENDAYLNALNTLHGADVLASSLLDFSDTIFGVSDANRHANDAFETYLCARDSTLKSKAEDAWKKNDALRDAWKADLDTIKSDAWNSEEGRKRIVASLQSGQALMESLRDFADISYSCMEKSVSTPVALPDATITSYKTQFATFRTNIESMLISVNGNYIVGIKGSLQNIANIGNEKTLQLTLLEKQVNLAKKAHEVALSNYTGAKSTSSGKNDEVSVKAKIAASQLEIAKAQYNEAVAGLAALEKQKDTQLSSISTQLAGIQGNKDLAGINIDNTTIVAPYDGVIVEKISSVGQVVGAGTPIFQIAKDDSVKIKVLVWESDAHTLSVGENATISIAGLPNTITGAINMISPVADTLSKKVPVEIRLDNKNRQILLGSYANVSFQKKALEGKTIPYRFVEFSYGKSILHVLRDGKNTPVSIGLLECDTSNCLVEGDVAVGETLELP